MEDTRQTPLPVALPSESSDTEPDSSQEKLLIVTIIPSIGTLILISFAFTTITYHLVKRKRRRLLLTIEQRLNAMVNSRTIVRVIESSLENQTRAGSGNYDDVIGYSRRFTLASSTRAGSDNYEDVIEYSGRFTLASSAQHRTLSVCSSNSYVNKFDGPLSSLPAQLARQRSEPALYSTALPPQPPPSRPHKPPPIYYSTPQFHCSSHELPPSPALPPLPPRSPPPPLTPHHNPPPGYYSTPLYPCSPPSPAAPPLPRSPPPPVTPHSLARGPSLPYRTTDSIPTTPAPPLLPALSAPSILPTVPALTRGWSIGSEH